MPTITSPNNPFHIGTAEYLDFEIWKAGIYSFNNIPYFKSQNPPPHELDYLRGFHNIQTLRLMQRFLNQKLLDSSIRLTSIWLDKSPWVYPYEPGFSSTRRELADLAIVVRSKRPFLLEDRKSVV